MSKESFFYAENYEHLKLLDEAARRGGVSRGKAFDDFLLMTTCALARPRMEQEYLEAVKPYIEGKPGQRGCDSIAQLFGRFIAAMEETHDEIKDVLGDFFQGGITYGENGQFLTPEPVCEMMARMTIGHDLKEVSPSKDETKPPERESVEPESFNSSDPNDTASDISTSDQSSHEGSHNTDSIPSEFVPRKRIFDPACGSGRMLLAVAKHQRQWEFFGRDIDLRCVRMTAINLALRNLYGYVFWGDSLRDQIKLAYRTGFNGLSVIRYARSDELADLFASESAQEQSHQQSEIDIPVHSPTSASMSDTPPSNESREEVTLADITQPTRQLRLF